MVKARQSKLHVRIFRQDFGQVLVGLDGLLIVVNGPGVDSRNQVLFLGRELFAQAHSFSDGLLGLVGISQVGVGLTQLGVSQSEVLIFPRGCLEALLRLENLALVSQLQSFVVVAQRLNRLRRRFEGPRLKLFDNVGGQSQALLDVRGQLLDGSRELLFTRGCRFQSEGALLLQVAKRYINANLVPEPGELSPEQPVSAGEFPNPSQCIRIDVGVRRDPQVVENLTDSAGGNCLEVSRLSYVRVQHLCQTRPQPVERGVARSIAERQDRKRDGGRGGPRLGDRPEDFSPENHNGQQEHERRERGPNPLGGELFHRAKPRQAQE